MKKKHLIGRIISYMAVLIVLLAALLAVYAFSSYSILSDELQTEATGILAVYGGQLKSRVTQMDTAIGGLSMGGFGALRNGLFYADTFVSIVALSSALITEEVAAMTPETGGNAVAPYGYYRHTFGDLSSLLGSDRDPRHLAVQRLAVGKAPRMFLACGTEDFLYTQNTDFHTYLNQIGYPHEWWTRSGVHNFEFWNQATPVAMDWLPKA